MPLKITERKQPKLVSDALRQVSIDPDSDVKWWRIKPGPERAQAIYANVRKLEQEQSGRRQLDLLHMTMYANGNIAGEGLKGTLRWNQAQPIRLRMNLANAIADALQAKVAKLRPRPRYITVGGDWGMRKRAEAAEQAIDGEFYRNKLDSLSPRVGLDAFITGTGFWHVRRTGVGYPVIERCGPGEVTVGYYDGLQQKPRAIFRSRLVDRDELIEQFAPRRGTILHEQIMSASNAPPNHYPWLQAKQQTQDQVYVVEAWHKGTNPGYAFVCGDADLITEHQWDGQRFPIVPYRWSDRQAGYFGKGAIEEVTPQQIEINYNLEKIQHILHNVSTVRYWVQAQAGNRIEFNAKRATNFPGEFLTFYGPNPPIKEATDSIPRELWEGVDRCRGQAYQLVGLNENFATATKPVGLNSGEAQRVYEDVGDARMLLKGRGYEQAHLELCEVVIDVKKQIASDPNEKENPVVVERKRARGVTVKSLSFKDFDMSKMVYMAQLLEQSALPGTPAGKTATVQEWLQMGLISPEEGKELLNMPDIKSELNMSLATKDSVLSAIEEIADNGEWVAPHAFLDLALATRLAVASYTRLEWEGLPDDRLELLAKYIGELQLLSALAAPPPMPGMPAGMPGAPGLPDVAGQLEGVPQRPGVPPPPPAPNPQPKQATQPQPM